MSEYAYTRILSRIVALLTLLSAIGFGLLSFLGTSLSKALNSNIDSSPEFRTIILVFLALIACSLITGIGSFWLANKRWCLFYIGFCFLIGAGFIVGFCVSYGALGAKNELFIFIIGAIYLSQSFWRNKKSEHKKSGIH